MGEFEQEGEETGGSGADEVGPLSAKYQKSSRLPVFLFKNPDAVS
jgi:hypothetical protein